MVKDIDREVDSEDSICIELTAPALAKARVVPILVKNRMCRAGSALSPRTHLLEN